MGTHTSVHLGDAMDREARQATVHSVVKSQMELAPKQTITNQKQRVEAVICFYQMVKETLGR